jgi:hypothetical protein
MRKITDGYARQVLKTMLTTVGDTGSYPFPNDMIRVKKSALHLGRVIRFKRKELERTITPRERELAKQVYKEAHDFMEAKKPVEFITRRDSGC